MVAGTIIIIALRFQTAANTISGKFDKASFVM
jgi:hypothetical protein